MGVADACPSGWASLSSKASLDNVINNRLRGARARVPEPQLGGQHVHRLEVERGHRTLQVGELQSFGERDVRSPAPWRPVWQIDRDLLTAGQSVQLRMEFEETDGRHDAPREDRARAVHE